MEKYLIKHRSLEHSTFFFFNSVPPYHHCLEVQCSDNTTKTDKAHV